ncbi:hypothetical protein B0H21DRAFT_719143 [Amylocystis lapponica]|nr:hypothetical protein B0H21DRAFT_719143 [Amylocystis lapponica]
MGHTTLNSSRTARKVIMHRKQDLWLVPLSSDLGEKQQKDVDQDEPKDVVTHHFKVHTAEATTPKPTSSKVLPKPASDVDIHAVPNPIPDTGLTTSIRPSVASATQQSFSPFNPLPSSTPPPGASFGAGFSPLPLLASFAATTSMATVSSTLSLSGKPSVSSGSGQHQDSPSQPPKHLPTVIIVLITIGIAFLLLGVYVSYRMCTRPRKHTRPTPSLPILQDDYPEKEAGDEESFFGGKERVSGRESNALWTWTQYSQPSSLYKPPSATLGNQGKPAVSPRQANYEQTKAPHTSFNAKTGGPFAAPIARVPSAPTRAGRRVSVMSASVYPGSPQSTRTAHDVGLAFGGASPLTADGTPVLQRSNTKSSPGRLAKNRRSMRYSVYDRTQSTDMGEAGTDAYGGAQVMSPTPSPPKVVLTRSHSVQGRARVQAPYAPGSLLRASSTVSAFGSAENPFNDSQYILPPLSPALKSDALREQDTKALTSALGLASPTPLSPHLTLYPDDSVTLAGTRRQSRVGGLGRPRSSTLSPGMEASARLGHLMLEDFNSMASLPSARTVAGTAENPAPARTKSTRKRADEKPPRVPSPPPMPSLAQMAMAHTHGEEFADYRSPTYSIYGLYEAERKSHIPGGGGY